MNIQNNTPFLTFQGYDARHFKCLCMTTMQDGIADELAKIGKKVGFDVYVAEENSMRKIPTSSKRFFRQSFRYWAQDAAIVTPKGNVIGRTEHFAYQKVLNKFLGNGLDSQFFAPAGGNVFYIKEANGKNSLLVGSDSIAEISDIEKCKKMYGVDKFEVISQMDFHLDLFVRPLDQKRILVADDNLTIQYFENAIAKIKHEISNTRFNIVKKMQLKFTKMLLQSGLNDFKRVVFANARPQTDIVASQLEKLGYSVHRVPGRLYELNQSNKDLMHFVNYMNAVVTKDKKGNLVYITNKSDFDEIMGVNKKYVKGLDISFEKAFIKSLTPFVNESDVYFVKGENYALSNLLTRYYGGLHCLITEIPK